MSKGIYTALSGALAQNRRVESIANNLANVNTNGYKKDDITFREYLTTLEEPEKETPVPHTEFKPGDFYHLNGSDKSFAVADSQYTDHSQGSLRLTGRDLDIALQGKGFFEVGTPQGVRYTRNGVLNIDANGVLVNSEGFPILSKPGAAAAPATSGDFADRRIELGRGKITVTENGDVFQAGNFIASMQVTEFRDVSQLKKQGSNLLRNDSAENILTAAETTSALGAPAQTSTVLQKHLESSNVNPVKEMIDLLEAQRLFEQNLKTISSFDGIAQKAANDIGRF